MKEDWTERIVFWLVVLVGLSAFAFPWVALYALYTLLK